MTFARRLALEKATTSLTFLAQIQSQADLEMGATRKISRQITLHFSNPFHSTIVQTF